MLAPAWKAARDIRSPRLRRGLSQRQLASLAGFRQPYLVQVEKGVRGISLKYARILEGTLGGEARRFSKGCLGHGVVPAVAVQAGNHCLCPDNVLGTCANSDGELGLPIFHVDASRIGEAGLLREILTCTSASSGGYVQRSGGNGRRSARRWICSARRWKWAAFSPAVDMFSAAVEMGRRSARRWTCSARRWKWGGVPPGGGYVQPGGGNGRRSAQRWTCSARRWKWGGVQPCGGYEPRPEPAPRQCFLRTALQ